MKAKRLISRGRQVYDGWFKERFGTHYAQISVDTTLKLKSSVRDVSRALRGHIPPDIEDWAKKFLIPPQGVTDYHFVMGYHNDEGFMPGSLESDQNLQAYVNRYPKDWDIVKKCLGLSRQKGRHACAYVVANCPISEFIPLTTISGVKVTAYTAPAVEAVGGLKMDFLTVNSLKDIQDCIALVQSRHNGSPGPRVIADRHVPAHRLVLDPISGNWVDIWDLPEDQNVFANVAEGKTETVFQYNTEGALKWLRYFNYNRKDGTKAINSIESMAAFTALDRPGPLDVQVWNPDVISNDQANPTNKHNMLVEYARRARGAKGSPDVLSVLEHLLPDTYGVMVYQEQLQRVYQNLTGCTGSEAEEFRTNIAKKKKEKVDQAYPKFMERAGSKVGIEDAQKLWDFIKTWGQYGFNKSHAVCYATIGYACAWLKHHYSLEWWCSVLSNAKKEEVNSKFWRHCGHLILLPDVKLSSDKWSIQEDKIRAPVSLLHGIGVAAHEQLCKYAPYESIEYFAKKIFLHKEAGKGPKQRKKPGTEEYEKVIVQGRSAITRRTVYTLIVSGAMDSLFPKDAPVDQCLKLYDKAMIEVFGKKHKSTPEDKYPVLDCLGHYQTRKSILPAYGQDLRPLVKSVGVPEFLKLEDEKRMRYVYKRWDRDSHKIAEVEDPVIGVKGFDAMVNAIALPKGGYYRAAVIAFVEEAETFQYGPGKTKQALRLTLEVGGGKYELVHWPDGNGILPKEAKEVASGAIVVALLAKTKIDKPFAVRELRIVREPIKKNTEEDKESKEPEDA